MTKVRVRIAPSPTGSLHLGNARSALFNYVYAKKYDGAFILRIEDTDVARSESVYEDEIIEILTWLGLNWDEFYRESDRGEIYKEYLGKLLREGKIFWCGHSKEKLTEEKAAQMQSKDAPRHICEFRNADKTGKNEGAILRFKNDVKGDIEFIDLIRGKISFKADLLGDFSVARSLDSSLYNFAVAIDDALMNITHVIRGEDHISNTPKQILLLDALGFKLPEYAHLPLILGKDRSKMSKRHGPVAVLDYRKEGYLPEAMVNFLALLGWHPTKIQNLKIKNQNEDIFSIEELAANFELANVQKGGAIFDIDKLNWMNGEYVRRKTIEELAADLIDFLKPEWQDAAMVNPGKWRKIVLLEQPRLTRMSDIESRIDYFFKEPLINKEELGWRDQKEPEIRKNLEQLVEMLAEIPEGQFTKENVEKALKILVETLGSGEVLWPLRYAMTGKRASPGPFEIADVLGKEIAIARLKNAIGILK